MNLPPLPNEFFSASGGDLANITYKYLDGVLRKRYLDAEDEVLAALPGPLADYWILLWLDLEVIQGGLRTYFMNSEGRHAQLAIDALRRCGGEGLAECLQAAFAIYSQHEAAWAKRMRELDAQGEYAVVRPFQSLEGIDELLPATQRFEDEWFDGEVWWGDLVRNSLQRFRDEMAKKRTSADEEAAKTYWSEAEAREEEAKAREEEKAIEGFIEYARRVEREDESPKAHEGSAKVRKELPPEAEALIALLEQKKAEADRSRWGRGE